ncbi:MAG: dihydrofolate reductase [Chlorobi bacterium]|nr:dihydrofolate reductase [Chlorobiota bacterium]
MSRRELYMIAAVGRRGEIGKDGDLIWRISEDLKRFKRLTMGGALIMGRKTYASIGRPLPGRFNIVLSRREDFQAPGIWIRRNAEAALDLAECLTDKIFVIGGESIYTLYINKAQKLFLTEIDAEEPAADAFFPAINPDDWETEEVSEWYKTEDGLRYRYKTLKRIA